jgi:hypothetical protein
LKIKDGTANNWFDIEAKILEALKNGEAIKWTEDFDNSEVAELLRKSSSGALKAKLKYLIYTNRESSATKKEGYAFLLEELEKFEKKFRKYVIKQCENDEEKYSENANKLVETLTHTTDDWVNFAYILSFNYTTTPRVFNVINVHGTAADIDADGKIIFGVDDKAFYKDDKKEKDWMPDGSEIFSKTYRKLLLKKRQPAALNKDVKQISFFGHSLSQGDYSYFQSIFDFYEIYKSDVALTFFFVYHGDKPHAEQRREKADAVHKLLKAYGESMSNKDQGDNLLHKLMLEGRVRIDFDTVTPPQTAE